MRDARKVASCKKIQCCSRDNKRVTRHEPVSCRQSADAFCLHVRECVGCLTFGFMHTAHHVHTESRFPHKYASAIEQNAASKMHAEEHNSHKSLLPHKYTSDVEDNGLCAMRVTCMHYSTIHTRFPCFHLEAPHANVFVSVTHLIMAMSPRRFDTFA